MSFMDINCRGQQVQRLALHALILWTYLLDLAIMIVSRQYPDIETGSTTVCQRQVYMCL